MSLKKKPFLFVAFEKVEKQEDGTLLVSGVASSEAVDSDGEVITSEAMKAALPDYMKFAAVREMHQPIAAGTALKCEVGEDGRTTIEAKIVDPTTVLKIEEDVLKGFSVGGRVTSRDPLNKNTITGIKLTEISVVDRPANPEALFVLGKVDGADEPEPTLGDLRKSLYQVQDFAGILRSLGWLAQDVAMEAEWEGDNSPVPAALVAGVVQLVETFKTFAVEEVEEFKATLPAPPSAEVLQMAEKLAKGATPETLQKVASLEADLQKAQTTIDTLTKRVAELEALPAPPKGVVTVSKGQDITPNTEAEEALLKRAEEIDQLPPEQRSYALLKVMFANHPGGK